MRFSLTIHQQIRQHKTWLGNITGLAADKLLRGRKRPYLYFLRAGEFENDYYITYVASDFSIQHTPFTIKVTPESWGYETSVNAALLTTAATIDDVLHIIMQCTKSQPASFVKEELAIR